MNEFYKTWHQSILFYRFLSQLLQQDSYARTSCGHKRWVSRLCSPYYSWLVQYKPGHGKSTFELSLYICSVQQAKQQFIFLTQEKSWFAWPLISAWVLVFLFKIYMPNKTCKWFVKMARLWSIPQGSPPHSTLLLWNCSNLAAAHRVPYNEILWANCSIELHLQP